MALFDVCTVLIEGNIFVSASLLFSTLFHTIPAESHDLLLVFLRPVGLVLSAINR